MVEGFRSLRDAHSVMSFLAGSGHIEFTTSKNVTLLPYSDVSLAFEVLSRAADQNGINIPYLWGIADSAYGTVIASIPTHVVARTIIHADGMPVASDASFYPQIVDPKEIVGYFPKRLITLANPEIMYSVFRFESPDKETDMCIVQTLEGSHWSINAPVFESRDQHIEFAKMVREYIDLRHRL